MQELSALSLEVLHGTLIGVHTARRSTCILNEHPNFVLVETAITTASPLDAMQHSKQHRSA